MSLCSFLWKDISERLKSGVCNAAVVYIGELLLAVADIFVLVVFNRD